MTDRRLSSFASNFAKSDVTLALPRPYRDFILMGVYLKYQTCFIRGLPTYGPTDVELSLVDPVLLDRDRLFEKSDIEPENATEYYPIAVVVESPQFLAIDRTVATAPVFLWHHETGAFSSQFETFEMFVGALRTRQQVETERARTRRNIALIRGRCATALASAAKLLASGDANAAESEIASGLIGLRPIPYNGAGDFEAISILAESFMVLGRARLAQHRLDRAQRAFLDAAACRGRLSGDAIVAAVTIAILRDDARTILERLGEDVGMELGESPFRVLKRDFTPEMLDRVSAFANRRDLPGAEQKLADIVRRWLEEVG